MSAPKDQERREALEALAARVRGADDAIIDGFLASSKTFLESLEQVKLPAGATVAPAPAAEAPSDVEAAVAAQGALIRKLKEADGLMNSDSALQEAVFLPGPLGVMDWGA